MQIDDDRIRAEIGRLADARPWPATLCPSEAARALAPDGWRGLMPRVREAAIEMAKQGAVEIRQRGRTVDPAVPLRGPIRIGQKAPATDANPPPTTPDGRYLVVRGRLWRKADPQVPEDVRAALVRELMDARRALRGQLSDAERRAARSEVDRVKRALGERGPVWWTDGAPDLNRKLVGNTPYAEWYAGLKR